MANLCKNCGTVVDDNAPFCPACGTPVPQGQQFQQQGQQFPQQGQQFPQQGQQFPQQGQQFPQQGQQFPQQGQQFPQQGQQFPQQGQQFPQQEQQFPQQGQQFPQQGQQFPQQGQQFQQQGQQFPQQGMQGPPPGAPPKKGLSKKLMIIIGGAAVVVIGVVLVLIFALGGNSYESEEFFDVGGDEIPSVMYVLGEKRKISDVTISSSKSADKMVIEYSVSENQGDDMEEYAGALVDDFDFIALDEYDFGGKRGSDFQFVKVSDEDDDHIVIVTIDFNNSGYTLTIERKEGELNVGDVDPGGDDGDDNNNNDDNDNNGGDDDDNNAGDDDDDNNAGDDDDNNGGDEPDETPPPAADEIEIKIPRILAGGKTVEEAQGKAPAGVTVVSLNPDETFTFSMTDDRRMELVEEYRNTLKQLCDSLPDDTPGVTNVHWDSNLMFEWIRLVVNEKEFDKEENKGTTNYALVRCLVLGPMVQVYSGAGLNTYFEVQWSESLDSGEWWYIPSPEALYNMEK